MENLTFLHFTSDVDFNLNINGEFIKTCTGLENKYITIATTKNSLYFTFLPISTKQTYLPFTQMLNITNNNVSISSQYVEVVPFKNNHYEVILTAPLSATNTLSSIIREDYFGKINIVLLNNNNGNIFVYEDNKLKKQFVTSSIINAEIKQINNNIIIKCELEEDKYFLVILNADNLETLCEGECDIIEENEEEIKSLKKMLDLSKHASVLSFSLQSQQIENYKVYLDGEPKRTTNKLLVPLAFLQALQYENFDLAKSYLSEELAETANSEFEGYFGKIQNIYLDRYNLNAAEVGYTVKSNGVFSLFEFAVDNGVIKEITKA